MLLAGLLGASGCAGTSGPPVPGAGPPVGVVAAPLPTVIGPLPVTPASYPFLASDHDAALIDLARFGYIEQDIWSAGARTCTPGQS